MRNLLAAGACLVLGMSGVGPLAHAVGFSPPPSGLYEMWSPVTLAPVGRLSAPPQALPRWLDVVTHGEQSVVRFLPEGRIVWRVRWGAHGIVHKITEVDGETFSTSEFAYDPAGRLLRKTARQVDGLSLKAEYATDARGRLLSKNETAVGADATVAVKNTWRYRWKGDRVVIEQLAPQERVRRDEYDADGRRVRSDFYGRGLTASLLYERGADGTVRSIQRKWGTARARPADPSVPDDQIASAVLQTLERSLVERYEAHLLLGAPITQTDEGKGSSRRVTDQYSKDCWLNELSTLHHDASERLERAGTSCVCGFCVAAPTETLATDVNAVDLHFTEGPWVNLVTQTGSLVLTADHRVVTPNGSVPAARLRPGDEALDGARQPVRILRVESLPRALRLGQNLRTKSGEFVAGGLLVESEAPRSCP